MTNREWAMRAIADYMRANPDEPDVIRLREALAELPEREGGEQ